MLHHHESVDDAHDASEHQQRQQAFPCLLYTSRAYDASVEDKGIVVVSRSSEAAQATGAVSSEELASKRTVAVAQANAASPHTKGCLLYTSRCV